VPIKDTIKNKFVFINTTNIRSIFPKNGKICVGYVKPVDKEGKYTQLIALKVY
jgi:hypothetical protein